MKDLLFISYSKNYAGEVANELKSFIEGIFEDIEVFTSLSINSGNWDTQIHEKIVKAKYGISVLTPENIKNSPWLMYEAGALVASIGNKFDSLTPFLFCRHKEDLEAPLKKLQALSYFYGKDYYDKNKDQLFRLIEVVNEKVLTKPLPDIKLKTEFNKYWKSLNKEFEDIAKRMLEKDLWRHGIETLKNKPILTDALVTFKQSDISIRKCNFFPKTPREIESYFEKILKNIPADWKILDPQTNTKDAHRVIIGDNTRISTFVSFTDGEQVLIIDRKSADSKKTNVENPKLDVFGSVQFENRSLSIKIPNDLFLDSKIIEIKPIYGIAIEENRPKDNGGTETVIMLGVNIYMKTEDLEKAVNQKDIWLYPKSVLNAKSNELTSKAHLAVMSLI